MILFTIAQKESVKFKIHVFYGFIFAILAK
jgi:hypothetical protein